MIRNDPAFAAQAGNDPAYPACAGCPAGRNERDTNCHFKERGDEESKRLLAFALSDKREKRSDKQEKRNDDVCRDCSPNSPPIPEIARQELRRIQNKPGRRFVSVLTRMNWLLFLEIFRKNPRV